VVSQKLTFLIFFAFITSVLFSYFLPAGPLRMSTVGFPGSYFSTALREERARSPRPHTLHPSQPQLSPQHTRRQGLAKRHKKKAPLCASVAKRHRFRRHWCLTYKGGTGTRPASAPLCHGCRSHSLFGRNGRYQAGHRRRTVSVVLRTHQHRVFVDRGRGGGHSLEGGTAAKAEAAM
jgi:hypothetical protein